MGARPRTSQNAARVTGDASSNVAERQGGGGHFYAAEADRENQLEGLNGARGQTGRSAQPAA